MAVVVGITQIAMQILSQSKYSIVNTNNLINISIEGDYRKEKEQTIEGFSIVTLSSNERVRVVLGFFQKEETITKDERYIWRKSANNKL